MKRRFIKFWHFQICCFLFAAGVVLTDQWIGNGPQIFRQWFKPDVLVCGPPSCFITLPYFFLWPTFFLLKIFFLYVVFILLGRAFFHVQQPSGSLVTGGRYPLWIFGMILIIVIQAFFNGYVLMRDFFRNEHASFHQSYSQRYSEEFPMIYSFAAQSKRHVCPVPVLRARLVSDMDFSDHFGMTVHRALAFFLYPIDIRECHPRQPVGMYVFFNKKNAEQFVPSGNFRIMKFSDQYMIAVKDE